VLAALAVLAASAASLLRTSSSQAEFLGNLTGNVGPGFVIQLRLADGTPVSSLAAGTYDIHVSDVATNHNFHLEGQGVNVATAIADLQEADWTVDFVDGNYTYRCDQHSNLSAAFMVGGIPATLPAPVPAPAPAPVQPPASATVLPLPTSSGPAPVALPVTNRGPAGSLKVTLLPNDTISVTKSGKAVTKIPRGTYNLVLADRSGKRDLALRRIGGDNQALTSKGFVGTKTVNVDLTPGQWKLFSAANEGGIFAFFRVSKS
jgi:hypothetical protein